MKFVPVCILSCLFLICCDKSNNDSSNVDAFIETLKEDKIEDSEIPELGIDDISQLLDYRNDQLIISNFPRNPLSSFYMEEVELGMYILWTIEALRMEAIEDPKFYLFASLNPRVVNINTAELLNQNDVLPEVAIAYFDWWNSTLATEEKLQINPLEKIDLIWN